MQEKHLLLSTVLCKMGGRHDDSRSALVRVGMKPYILRNSGGSINE